MKFPSMASLLLSAAYACAENTISFVSLDNVDRTMHFTPNPGSEVVHSVNVPGGQNVTVTFPYAWQGNAYAVPDGAENVPGVLAEVAFNGWRNFSFFDVSVIVQEKNDGVMQVFPAVGGSPVSGCERYAHAVCDNVYVHPDDVQTKSTSETELICTLGSALVDGTHVKPRNVPAEDSPSFTRDFVLGKWSSKRR